MPILTTATGLIRPLVSGVRPVSKSPSNIAAPAIITPPSGLSFDFATARPGVPAVNDQFEYFSIPRDWAFNFKHPTQGFGSIRWQPTWKRADGFYGSWEPAEGEIYRIQRKGATGAAAQTLVFTCGPNPATVPIGEKVVIWDLLGWDGSVAPTTSRNLSGYNLPLRSKMTVTGGAGSAQWDANGRRIIEVAAGVNLPAIDYTVPSNVDTGQTMRLRHWAFYKNTATKEMRHPLGWFSDISINSAIANGGYIMLGGLQGQPTWYDWTVDHRSFGASLTEELWRLECEGLAYHMGGTDPRKLAVELENEPTSSWAASVDGVGYGDLLPDVWYGIARQVWGQERTLVLKGTGFGGLGDLLESFNFRCPAGHNAHLVSHNYDGQVTNENGQGLMNFGDIAQTDYYARALAGKITELGYKGGGMTEFGVRPYEWWSQWPDGMLYIGDAERGKRMGRMTTSLSNRGLYNYVWGATGDDANCADVYPIDGHDIEAFYPTMRPYAARAGLTTT